MQLLTLLYLLATRPSVLIKNIDAPVCANCVHFIEHNNYPHDPVLDFSQFGKCKMFGSKNVITGQIIYDYVTICRSRECGINGKYYEAKKDNSTKSNQ